MILILILVLLVQLR